MPAGSHAEPGKHRLQRLSITAPRPTTPRWRRIRCLHTGISGGCASMSWRYHRTHLVQQFHAQGRRAGARAHSLSGRHRLQCLPLLEQLRGRHLWPDEHDAGQALPSSPRPAPPATRRDSLSTWARRIRRCRGARPITPARTMSAPNDCGGCHTTANWNSNTLPAGHMPNPANSACTVCHTGPEQLQDSGGEFGAAYRHQHRLRPMPWRYDRAHLVQQFHAQGRRAHAFAHSVSWPAPTAVPATPPAPTPPAPSAPEHDAGHARLRLHHLRHLP